MSTTKRQPVSAGAKFRQAVAESQPLQVVGAITAYAAKMAEQTGFKAVYLSGGGVAAVLFCWACCSQLGVHDNTARSV